jgi:epoxide hydrolase-like predicted phosphatase
MKAVLFDFMGVVGYSRMAVAGDPGNHPQRVVMYEDVVDAIHRLRANGFKLALVSNNDRQYFSHVAPDIAVELENLFDVVVYSSDVDAEKPDPRIYRHALDRLGVEPEDAHYFDDLARNVDAAVQLGMSATVVMSTADVTSTVDDLLDSFS